MAPSRRPHKKSRRGCAECKRRHVKCDETRPICVQCSLGRIRCSFVDQEPPPTVTTPCSTTPSQPTISPQASGSSVESPAQQQQAPQEPDDLLRVNMHHMEYLSHFLLETSYSLGSSLTNIATFSNVLMRFAVTTPYVMYEILALGALHFGHLRPERHVFYRNEATRLQTHALSLFNSVDSDIDAETCVPLFLFSSILGIHVLADVATAPDDAIDSFLGRFIFSMQVRRGIRTITSRSWCLLLESDLKPILKAAERDLRDYESSGECDKLRELFRSSSLGTSVLDPCQAAIDRLQSAFDYSNSNVGRNIATSVVFVWPVHVPAEYEDLLKERRPEALVVLAYYGILLHAHRGQWFVGNSGQMLITAIVAELGPAWDHWLAWPKSSVAPGAAETSPPR